MSEKTELPTRRKREEAAKKGQVFDPADLGQWLSLSAGIAWLSFGVDMSSLLAPLRSALASGAPLQSAHLLHDCMRAAIGVVAPLIAIVFIVSSIVSGTASGFALATEALVPDVSRLDPIQGVQRIFSFRTLVSVVCALAYCLATGIAVWTIVHVCSRDLFDSVRLHPHQARTAWFHIVLHPLVIVLACFFPVCVFHALCERRVHTRDLRMEKREVKQEMRDHDMKPEVRARRRDLFLDLLDEQSRRDISDSKFVLANPTHIAVGIYVNEAISAWPFVSIRASNRRALAVIAYAESVGVPVIRDRKLARSVYRDSRRYRFVNHERVEEIVRIVNWLSDVERAQRPDDFVQAEQIDAP